MEYQNPSIFKQDLRTPIDVKTWVLPEGAVTRIGRGRIQCIAFSSDENSLAVGSSIGLWIYDVSTMNPAALWATESGLVSAVAFSPDGALLATGNWNGNVELWNVQDQRCVSKMKRLGRFEDASQIVFSQDGRRVAFSGRRYGVFYIWDPKTWKHGEKFTVGDVPGKGHRAFIPLAISPNGRFVACVASENTFSIWDIEEGNCIGYLTEHIDPIVALIFSPCGRFLTSGDQKGVLYKWEINKVPVKKPISRFTVLPTDVNAGSRLKLAYSTDRILLAAGINHGRLIVWDVECGNELGVLQSKKPFYKVNFSPSGSQLAMVVDIDKIQTWKFKKTVSEKPVIHGHAGVCGAAKFCPNGNLLAAGYWSNGITLRNTQHLKLQHTFRCKGLNMVRSIAFSPCGNKLAATSYDKTVRVWDIRQPNTPPVELTGHQSVLNAVLFSPKGDVLVSADANGILGVWDVQDDYKLKMFTNKTACIGSIAFSPDGQNLLSTHHRETARIWDVASGKKITELSTIRPQDTAKYKGDAHQIRVVLGWLKKGSDHSPDPQTIVYSPDGALIAGGVFREIRLWETTSYDTRMIICMPKGCQRPGALTFSPCGQYLASGSWWQGTKKVSIRLWEVATGENIATFWGHPTDIQDLSFSPDGTLLASGGFDGVIYLWDMKPYLKDI